jgi:hypothetical protein
MSRQLRCGNGHEWQVADDTPATANVTCPICKSADGATWKQDQTTAQLPCCPACQAPIAAGDSSCRACGTLLPAAGVRPPTPAVLPQVPG